MKMEGQVCEKSSQQIAKVAHLSSILFQMATIPAQQAPAQVLNSFARVSYHKICSRIAVWFRLEEKIRKYRLSMAQVVKWQPSWPRSLAIPSLLKRTLSSLTYSLAKSKRTMPQTSNYWTRWKTLWSLLRLMAQANATWRSKIHSKWVNQRV